MKHTTVVILPLLLDAISYYAYCRSDGMLFFVAVIFNLICVPIIFFKAFNCLFINKNISRKIKNTLLLVSAVTMLVFETVMISFVWGDSRISSVLVGIKAAWWIVCGFWAFLDLLYERTKSQKAIIKSAICIFAAVGLISCVLLNCLFEPLIAQKYGIDGLVLLPR